MEKNNDFTLLSLKEEANLSTEEKRKYYQELREYILNRPLLTTTKGATTIAPHLKGVTTKIAEKVTKVFTNSKDAILHSDGQENIPDGPVLFAHTHQGILDNFVWIPELDRHCIILHGKEVNKLLLLCQVNTGLVLVVKQDKENNLNAKLDMIKILLQGHSIAYFPEATWNLSPNKLHLPLRYGFLDIACKAQVPVVPVVHEFSYDSKTEKEVITKVHSRYCKPIYVSPDDDLQEKLQEYSEAIATARLSLIEEKGLYARDTISNQEYINYLKGNFKNLKLGKLNWAKETESIFGSTDDFYLFHHINEIPYDENGNLLATEEVRRLEKINRENHI